MTDRKSSALHELDISHWPALFKVCMDVSYEYCNLLLRGKVVGALLGGGPAAAFC